jgi:hypothetical protein
MKHCRRLMQFLADHATIDLFAGRPVHQLPALTTDWLFGPARGKMFGMLECLRPDGTPILLRAFSGQYNGHWLVDGWAPPLFELEDFQAINGPGEQRIKELGREIAGCDNQPEKRQALRQERRRLSRQLMRDLHGLYRLTNFRGETAGLADVFLGTTGIPTGTGDCCAPKLLNFAANHQLRPIGLTEFYWGRENLSGTRRHGAGSGPCVEKCLPILGFMLCGLDG